MVNDAKRLPEGWTIATIGELAERVTKGSTPTSYGFKYQLEGINFVKTENISEDGIIKDITDHIDEETNKFLSRSILQPYDILFSIAGTIGRVGIVQEKDIPANTNQALAILRGLHKKANYKFIYYYLKSPSIQKQALNSIVGVGRANLSLANISNFEIPLPSIPEQERIVSRIDELLSDLDAGVAALERVGAGLKRYKASVLKVSITGELLNGKLEIGKDKLPEGWRWTKLPELGHLGRGKSKHRPRNAEFLYGGDYPFIQTGDIRYADGTITSYTQTYSEAGLAQSKLWPKGTLCITIAANIADTAILGFDSCFPDSVVGFISNEDVEAKFIEFYIRTIKDSLERFAPATAQKNINLDVLQKVPIPLPSLDEQRRIVAEVERRLSVVREVESAVEAGLVRAGRLRQSVLRSAFEGRL
jgi:type I restriction enzyme S subunit